MSTVRDTMTRLVVVACAACAALVNACGGAGAAPKAPPAQDRTPAAEETTEPASVEAAQAQIERARTELDPGRARTMTEKAETAPADHAAPPLPPDAAGGGRSEGRPSPQATDTCGSPCRALASMRRAVDALCRMTGDEDHRCVEARRTLTESTTRVGACSCAAR